MALWIWLLVYLVGFTALQLVLIRYVGDDDSLDAPSLGSTPRTAEPEDSGADPGGVTGVERGRLGDDDGDDGSDAGSDDDAVTCRQCGTPNDDVGTYRYCRNCLAQLR